MVNSCGVVKQQFYPKEMSNSEEDVFSTLRQSSFGNSLGPSTATDFCVSRPTSHIASKDVRRLTLGMLCQFRLKVTLPAMRISSLKNIAL